MHGFRSSNFKSLARNASEESKSSLNLEHMQFLVGCLGNSCWGGLVDHFDQLVAELELYGLGRLSLLAS